jgi:hypothetical protein
VLLYHGLPLDVDPPEGAAMFSDKEAFMKSGVSPPAYMHDAAMALLQLLRPDGLGIISGNWTTVGVGTSFRGPFDKLTSALTGLGRLSKRGSQ